MLSVRELLSDLDVTVLAGQVGLDRPVRWVHISDLTDPTPWLSGGEVLLTTGLMALEDPGQQAAYIHRLADHQVAALGFATGFTHDRVPAAMIAAAAERDLPLFPVAYDLPFIAITEAASSRLIGDQNALLRRALQAQERLERIVLAQRGLDALAGALSMQLEASILVFGSRGEPLVTHAHRQALDPAATLSISEEIAHRVRRREKNLFRPAFGEPSRVLALPVVGEIRSGTDIPPEAWLVGIKDGMELSDFDRLLLRQAVTIVALELLRSRVADDTERRLAGDVVAAILAGELTGPELTRRLTPFGMGGSVAALVAETDLDEALHDEGERGLVAIHDKVVCAFVAGREDAELFALAERLAGKLGITVGVGRAVEADRARRTFHEARCALEALTLGLGRPASASLIVGDEGGSAGSTATATLAVPRVATFRDLGSYQLLLSLQDDAALSLFCDSVLGGIDASEGVYGDELIRSLEAFIEENGQWERAARRLYCHRHTLRYRIRRIEELTGRDLGSARDRIDFWLALRGRQIVQ